MAPVMDRSRQPGPCRSRPRSSGRRRRGLVRLQLDGAGDPPALRRCGAHDHLPVANGGPARERARVCAGAADGDAMRRGIGADRARHDAATRSPARRPRVRYDDPVVRRRAARRHERTDADVTRRRRTAPRVCPGRRLRWLRAVRGRAAPRTRPTARPTAATRSPLPAIGSRR